MHGKLKKFSIFVIGQARGSVHPGPRYVLSLVSLQDVNTP